VLQVLRPGPAVATGNLARKPADGVAREFSRSISRFWGCVTYREYSEQLLDHYRHPRNVGELRDADAVVTVGSPAHGDVLRLSLKILEGRVSDAQFKSFGCAVAIAAGSVTTVMIRGMRLEELERFGNLQVAEALGGVPESKMVCSVLAEQAIREALAVYRTRPSRSSSAESIREPHRGTVADSAAEAPSRR
jgi:nitrogen fixation protein NifU and related proteins